MFWASLLSSNQAWSTPKGWPLEGDWLPGLRSQWAPVSLSCRVTQGIGGFRVSLLSYHNFSAFVHQSARMWHVCHRHSAFFFFFFFFGFTHDIWKFLGQGSSLSHSCSNAGSFNPMHQARGRTHVPTTTQATAETVMEAWPPVPQWELQHWH